MGNKPPIPLLFDFTREYVSMNITAQDIMRMAENILLTAAPVIERGFQIPHDVVPKITTDENNPKFVVYTFERISPRDGNRAWYALAFYGNSNKPIFNFRFRSEDERERYIKGTMERYRQREQEQVKKRQERSEFEHSFKAGDILVSEWGYDQTNVDFYQVTDIRDKSVVIRQIASKHVGESMTENKVVPDVGNFIGQPMLKRPTPRNSIRLTSYSWAYKWGGNPHHETKSEFGH